MRVGPRHLHPATIAGLLLAITACKELHAQSAAPSPGQRDALEALSRTGDWSVRWDEETGSPATIEERRFSVGGAYRRPRPFSPESTALSFFQRHAGLFPLRPGRDSLVIMPMNTPYEHVRRRHGRVHRVQLNQSYKGLLVEGGGYKASLSADGKVLFVNGRFHRAIEVDPQPAISPEEGVRIAVQEVGAGADSVQNAPNLVVKRHQARAHLVWEVIVPEDLVHVWTVNVDAHDGRVISRSNRVIIN